MVERQFVSVFRSSKKAGTYIFVRRGQKWDDLPEALRTLFGAPQHAMDLLLTEDRKLARVNSKDVLDAIEEKDFYLQLPEEQDEYIVEFKQKLKPHPE